MDMLFIDVLENGGIKEFGKPDKVIETLLSKIFFFETKVIKVYKHKEAFYGNLADFAFRKEFYSEDFFWNHSMALDIYLKLVGVKAKGAGFDVADLDTADDFYIEMAKIDSSKNLTNLWAANKVSVSDMENVTRFLVEKLRSLTKERKAKLKHLFNLGWYKLQNDDFEDLRQWLYMAEDKILKKDVDAMIDLLKDKASKEPYFINYNPTFLSVAIDNNCDNLLILNGKPSSIDTMTPKDNWKVSDEYFNVARVAVDAYVLGNKELGDVVYRTYYQYRSEPSKTTTLINEIRSSLIQWPYRHILGQHEMAEKYKTFTLQKIQELKAA